MKRISCLSLIAVLVMPASGGGADSRSFRNKECAFRYPPNLKISVKEHGKVIQLVAPNHSAYWENTITIRKHNRKTDECEPPDGTSPDEQDRRKIAGLHAFSYSGDDAAMNRYTKEKGYLIETRTACWRFELLRRGRPYQKMNLSRGEVELLDKQSEQNAKAAKAAFKIVLDSFTLFPPER
jgi:hypothetical protein